MTMEKLMFSRDDLRKRLAEVLQHADAGKIVSIGSRWNTGSGSVHILNDERLGQLTAAADELKRLQEVEASTVQGRLTARLRHALKLLQEVNDKSRYSFTLDPITPEGIARTIGLETVSAFEDILFGRSPAPFLVLDKFADRYGFSREWLAEGSGEIFPSSRRIFSTGILDTIFEIGVSHGYSDGSDRLCLEFVLFEDVDEWPIYLFVGNGSCGHQKLCGNWNLDLRNFSDVRGKQLLEFYELLQELKTASEFFVVYSSVLNPQDYESFCREDCHPALVLMRDGRQIGWTDDIIHAVENNESTQRRIQDCYKNKKPFNDAIRYIQQVLLDDSQLEYRKRIEETKSRRSWWPKLLRNQVEADNDRRHLGGLQHH